MVPSLVLLTLLAQPPEAPRKLASEWGKQVEVELIIDGSGSMAGVVSGAPKIVWTHRGIGAVLSALPETLSGADIGLRVFGAHSPKAQHDCHDTRLEVPLEGVNRAKLMSTLRSVRPTGYTPLGASLEAAAQDFKKDGDRIVVIITDGVESCGADPCAISEKLVAGGAFQKPYVLGFAVDEAEKKRLSCIGTYIDARSGEELQKLLNDIVTKAVIAARLKLDATYNGKPIPASQLEATVTQGELTRPLEPGKAVRLPPGDYELHVSQHVDASCGPVVEAVTVTEGGIVHFVSAFGRGTVKFSGPGGGGDASLAQTELSIYPAGAPRNAPPLLHGRADATAKLCAGKYDFRFRHPTRGEVRVNGYSVKAGRTATVPLPRP